MRLFKQISFTLALFALCAGALFAWTKISNTVQKVLPPTSRALTNTAPEEGSTPFIPAQVVNQTAPEQGPLENAGALQSSNPMQGSTPFNMVGPVPYTGPVIGGRMPMPNVSYVDGYNPFFVPYFPTTDVKEVINSIVENGLTPLQIQTIATVILNSPLPPVYVPTGGLTPSPPVVFNPSTPSTVSPN